MKPLLVRTCVGLLLLLITLPLQAQGRKDLEKKRASLDKQIKTTTALIEQARKDPGA